MKFTSRLALVTALLAVMCLTELAFAQDDTNDVAEAEAKLQAEEEAAAAREVEEQAQADVDAEIAEAEAAAEAEANEANEAAVDEANEAAAKAAEEQRASEAEAAAEAEAAEAQQKEAEAAEAREAQEAEAAEELKAQEAEAAEAAKRETEAAEAEAEADAGAAEAAAAAEQAERDAESAARTEADSQSRREAEEAAAAETEAEAIRAMHEAANPADTLDDMAESTEMALDDEGAGTYLDFGDILLQKALGAAEAAGLPAAHREHLTSEERGISATKRRMMMANHTAHETCAFECAASGTVPVADELHNATALSDGCGAPGLRVNEDFPFHKCCHSHDVCLGTCNTNKNRCDLDFIFCMNSTCNYIAPNDECRHAAVNLYDDTVALSEEACTDYVTSQSRACTCVPGKSDL